MPRRSSVISSDTANDLDRTRNPPDRRQAAIQAYPITSLEQKLGLRLRAVRKEQSLSIAMLARKAHISVGTISKIENARMSASLATLQAIATALDLALTSLFTTGEQKQTCLYVGEGGGRSVKTHGTQAKHVNTALGSLRCGNLVVEPYLVDLADDARAFSELRYRGAEFIYLITGEAVYRHGDRDFALKPADSLLFDAAALHGPVGRGSIPVRYLSVTIHVHSSHKSAAAR